MACDNGICFVYSFLVNLVAFFAILALLVMISLVFLKYLGDWRRDIDEEIERGENMPLIHHYYNNAKIIEGLKYNYGTCQQDSNTSTNKMYDSTICTICYDVQRDCFFVPCGHCATCHICALRIIYKENRHCPICRRYIGKLRRLSV
ncbi:hypothetical protein RND81_02G133800 [Saponaria officinalis]|uniref:RING-type domain-containing protein n=1 Tax=Saponaria officinalis TaxID=3572 RepID=A0AAW1MLW7_SAPOF